MIQFQKILLDEGLFRGQRVEYFLADYRVAEETLEKIKARGLCVLYMRHGDDVNMEGCTVSTQPVSVNYYGVLVGASNCLKIQS